MLNTELPTRTERMFACESKSRDLHPRVLGSLFLCCSTASLLRSYLPLTLLLLLHSHSCLPLTLLLLLHAALVYLYSPPAASHPILPASTAPPAAPFHIPYPRPPQPYPLVRICRLTSPPATRLLQQFGFAELYAHSGNGHADSSPLSRQIITKSACMPISPLVIRLIRTNRTPPTSRPLSTVSPLA